MSGLKADVAEPVASRVTDLPDTIGVGMLGYAFMGKAHAHAYRALSYMTWPPPLRPLLVSVAGRVGGRSRRGGAAVRVRALDDRLARPRRRPRRRALRQLRPELVPRRADHRRGRGRQARRLREAARAHGRRVLRDVPPRRRDGRQAHVRVQLPLRPGRAARARDDRGRRARRDLPLPRLVPPGLDPRPGLRQGLAARPLGRGLRRARRPGRAHHRPRPLPRGRGRVDLRRPADVHRRPAGRPRRRRRRLRGDRRVRRRRRRHLRGLPLRDGQEELHALGDQRLQGLARLRPRAPERAAGEPRPGRDHRRGGPADDPRLRRGSPLLAALVAARARDRLGAHLRARAAPFPRCDRLRRRGRPVRSHLRGRVPHGGDLRRDRPLPRDARPRGD